MRARAFVALFLIFGACTSVVRFRDQPTSLSVHSQAQNRLGQAAQRWLGVPYRWGGSDRNGIDCSGLALRLYREAFHITLPRRAREQRALGYAVHFPYLKAGDLLFFRFKRNEGIEHVGVYLGNGRFIHASQTRGVVIDRLNDPYFRHHLVVIRRIVR